MAVIIECYPPRSSTIVASESGGQSNSSSSDGGRTTTRFGVGSPEGDESCAAPSLVIASTGEQILFEYSDAIEGSAFSANYFIIAVAVMKSLSRPRDFQKPHNAFAALIFAVLVSFLCFSAF